MSALASCQICGSRDQQTYVERAPVRYVRCRQCGLITNADAEALLAEAEEHYAEETYFGVYSRRFGQKLRSARRRIDLLRSYQPTGRLLDIGCGLGDTLIAAREAGYDASGLDIQVLSGVDEARAMDGVREKFGSASLTRGVLLGRDTGFTMPGLPD